MPHDPARMADARGWIEKAFQDLRAAEVDLGTDPPLTGDAVFHCQQVAEKVLKGFLAWHDVPFRKTHNLEEIGFQCEEIDPTLKPLMDEVVPLTEYAWKFRYPGEAEDPSADEANGALAFARKVYQAILERLPKEVRP